MGITVGVIIGTTVVLSGVGVSVEVGGIGVSEGSTLSSASTVASIIALAIDSDVA